MENGNGCDPDGAIPSEGEEEPEGEVRDLKKIVTWQVAMDIVDDVYTLTEGFPRHELWGLASQLQRAAVSVPSNIAEGRGRGSKAEYVRSLYVSRGSLCEVETQLLIAVRRKYVSAEHPVFQRVQRCQRLLHGLIKSLQ
jgi:four helix bundle protein